MAIKYYGGQFALGTNAERVAATWTNSPTGYRFFESDTGKLFYWNGSAFAEQVVTALSATLGVAAGGTGATTLTGVVTGNGTSAFTASNTLAGITLTTPIVNGINFTDVAKTSVDTGYTVTATDSVIRIDASGGAFTLNLPTAASVAGRVYTIKRTDVGSSTNLITIDANTTETIDGSLTHILYPAEWVVLESDGTNWQVIGRPAPSRLGYSFVKGSTDNRRYIAGLGDNFNALLVSTTSPAINTLWALPFFVTRTTKFDTITFHITSVSTAGHSRAGIYRDDGNNYPGALYFDTGTIDTTSTGIKDTTITAGLQVFQPGLYWLAYEQDTATGQMVCIPAGGAIIAIRGYSGTSLQTNPSYGYSVAHTYGTLPDPYTGSATNLTTSPAVGNPVPAIGLRPI